MQKLTRLVISCGGTGGHFYPGLSIARTFETKGGKVMLLLSGVNAVNQQKIAQSYGIEAVALPDMPSPRSFSTAMRFVKGLFAGYRQTRQALKAFAPEAALGMGSFASLPVIGAAFFGKVPYFLHDGNARIGKANRFLSRWARFMGTAFPPVNTKACHCQIKCTGMPLRPEILSAQTMTKEQATAALNQKFELHLEPDLPTILIFGGSQGASIFNQTVPQALKRLAKNDFQVLHLSGPKKFDEVKENYRNALFRHFILPGTEEMHLFYQACDLVFSRSGGSTVAEIAYFSKASVLVPYPYAAENHQYDNAMYLVNHKAAVLLDNLQCSEENVFDVLCNFLECPDDWQTLADQSGKLAYPEASDTMLKKIEQHL